MKDPDYFPATCMPDADWWQALWPDPGNVLTTLGLQPEMSVVDICCGDGHFTVPLASLLGPKGYLLAIDLSADFLFKAQSRMSAEGPEYASRTCKWFCSDVRTLRDLVADKVDAAFMANTFHGVPDQMEMALTIRDILKTGGRFVVVNWHDRDRGETVILGKPRGPRTDLRMTPDDLRQVVEAAGFRLLEIVELPPYHYGAVFKSR